MLLNAVPHNTTDELDEEIMRYWAGFKNGKLFHNAVDCGSAGEFLVPALYVNKKDAIRERDGWKKFDEIRRVEVKEINRAESEKT